MKLAGRVSAAIEILTEIIGRHRPASDALKDWGTSHRFAGSSDRHVVGTLVYDALRHKNSAAARGGADTARAIIFGTLANVWEMRPQAIVDLGKEQFGPGLLNAAEAQALAGPLPADLPPSVAGDFPQWLEPHLAQVFGDRCIAQMAAFAQRAPIDLRVNTLKTSRGELLAAFRKFSAMAVPFSDVGVRIPPPGIEARNINVEVEPAHGLGHFEVQDEASQVATILTRAMPGETVLDLCAGAGGKSLALAALMKNQGRLIAFDRDKHRLRPIFERINRSGATCIEVVAADERERLTRQEGFDLVVVDAPCTGSGTWRRKPDAKWRLSEKQLNQRLKEQSELLENASQFVRPGGRLAYFTCSVLPSENTAQIEKFQSTNANFRSMPLAFPGSGSQAKSAQLTPLDHGTDGFFITVMQRH